MGHRRPEQGRMFETDMCHVCSNGACVPCLVSCVCFGASQCYLRHKTLQRDMSKYMCCQAYICRRHTRHCSPCEESCPCLVLCCESFVCPCLAMSASRMYIQEERQIVTDPCDNRIIRFGNCLGTVPPCCCIGEASMCAADTVCFPIVCGMHCAQSWLELHRHPTAADYASMSSGPSRRAVVSSTAPPPYSESTARRQSPNVPPPKVRMVPLPARSSAAGTAGGSHGTARPPPPHVPSPNVRIVPLPARSSAAGSQLGAASAAGATNPSHAQPSRSGADAQLLPPPWRALAVGFFEQEEDWPRVLLSYQTHSTGPNAGKAWMWAVANGLREAGVTSFNGYQVTGGQDWQVEWFGVLPECDVLIVMLSQSYFKSEACVNELVAACKARKPIIPIYLEKVDVSGSFLGPGTPQRKMANFIRPHIQGNCVPPPDQGFFPGANAADFRRNMATLTQTIQSKHLTKR